MRHISLFSEEINLIEDEKLKEFAVECLKEAPQYFWLIPASSTGLHHPEFTQGEGGLVRHTKATITVAMDLLTAYPHLMPVKDQIIVALLLHDTIKLGTPPKEKTDPAHPIYPREYYKRQALIITPNEYNFIMTLIESHMGKWGPELKEQTTSCRLVASEFVHICDYIASRKWAEKLYCKKPAPKSIPIIHVYGQEECHDDMFVIANREGLLALQKAISETLEKKKAAAEVFVADGEGCSIKILLNDHEWPSVHWNSLAVPYTVEYASFMQSGVVQPWELWETAKNVGNP